MSVNLFTFIVLGAGLIANEASCITLAVLFSLFGAAAAINLPALGGASIAPALLFLPFLLLHALFARLRRQEPSALSRAGVLLGALVLWGVLSAQVLPRVFAGETQVFVLDRFVARAPRLYPLHPLPTNLTQSVYALGHLVCFLSLRTLLRAPGRLRTFQNAVLLVTALNVVAGVINLLESALGLASLLDYVRNAQGYAMAIEYSLGGLPRLHGTFPEASLFATYSLPLFAFCLSLWSSRAETRFSPPLTCLTLAMLLLATSAGGYLGLFLYACWYASRELPRKRVPLPLALLAACCAVGLLGMYALELQATELLDRFVHATLLDKADSGSGQERAAWNAQAWRNFLDTHALGAGLGSGRASSFPLVLLSNVGLFGAVMFYWFALHVCRSPYVDRDSSSAQDFAIRRAASEAVIALLLLSAVSAGMFDLGIAFYMFAAAASSEVLAPRRQACALELAHA